MQDIPIELHSVFCDPNIKDVEVVMNVKKKDHTSGKYYYDNLANNVDNFIVSNVKIEKELNKFSTLNFDLMMLCQDPDVHLLPEALSQIQVLLKNHTTNHTSNTFNGYILRVQDTSSSKVPFKTYRYECVAYEKALYDTIIVQRWDGKTATEIINDIWTNRLKGVDKYNFPDPVIDNHTSLTSDLGRIAHEDSIERLLDVLTNRTNSVWYFDDYSVLHVVSRETLENTPENLDQLDYDEIATPLSLDIDATKYANQVKFKAKNIQGNATRTKVTLDKDGTHTFPNKIHSISGVSDDAGHVYNKVPSLNKNSQSYQYVFNGNKIETWPLTASSLSLTASTSINNVIVRDNIPEQTRLKQMMEIGYIISKDITNERLQTIQQVIKYCDTYLKKAKIPTYEGKMTVHNLAPNSHLGRWGFDKKSVDIGNMAYVYSGLNGDTFLKSYGSKKLVVNKKIIELKFKNSVERTDANNNIVPTLSLQDFIVHNEFVDGLKYNWEDRFRRDKRQFYEEDINDEDNKELTIDIKATYDIITNDLNGQAPDTTLTKDSHSGSVNKAMTK